MYGATMKDRLCQPPMDSSAAPDIRRMMALSFLKLRSSRDFDKNKMSFDRTVACRNVAGQVGSRARLGVEAQAGRPEPRYGFSTSPPIRSKEPSHDRYPCVNSPRGSRDR